MQSTRNTCLLEQEVPYDGHDGDRRNGRIPGEV